MGKVARVRVYWDLSVSPDVVSQTVTVHNITDDAPLVAQELSRSTNEIYFEVPEKKHLEVSLTVTDGVNNSEAVTLSLAIPDLSVPAAPTNLGWEIVEVLDETVEEE